MGIGKGLAGLRLLAILGIVAVPTSALAHARLVSPAPRNNSDGLKAGPCGGVTKTASFTQLDAGATITVEWEETIDHSGCFDFALSTTAADPASGDKWVHLKRVPDPDGTVVPKKSTTTLELPPGVTCESCTLALRQVMQNATGGKCPGGTCTCAATDPDEMDGGSPTYFSCADIRIGDFPDAAPSADAGTEDEDGGSSSGGPTTVPTDGGGRTTEDNGTSPSRNLRAGAGDDGCNVGWGAPGGASLLASVGIGALAVLRRRRRSK